jgi:acetylornithine/N-succinyldiaminopimelate aminotransferase
LMPGFIQVPFNNLDELKKNIDDSISAIMIEPIQGEGGINPANLSFLEDVRKICDQNEILFLLDEVQSGFGRTGKLFAYEWGNFEPDILATAKGIGSGFPLGACLSNSNSCKGMIKGSHGSTFGGNPLAVSVGIEVIKIMTEDGFLERVDKNSRYLWSKLKEFEKIYNEIIEVRGAGLLLGIKTKIENNKFNDMLTKNGLLCITASDNIVRLAPPLIVEKNEIDEALQIIEKTIKEIND